jgi:uracil-DNA glycosylase
MSSKSMLLLKSLQEDGINEIYRDPRKPAASDVPKAAQQASSSVQQSLISLRSVVLPCTLCKELADTRKNVVFGAGNSQARLMFVGEAPGADEDIQGLPFVGAAGQLLTKIIESIGLKREEVFIANVLKCRPPGNRQPKPQEISNCEPYLLQQIQIIRPEIICALGTFAAQTLLKVTTPISRLRGQFYELAGSKLICTYHPAYLLRTPGDKRLVWEDMKKIKKELELSNA